MAIPEHLTILKEGVDAWNTWRNRNPNVLPDLSSADLRGIQLVNTDLARADLTNADLKGARLGNAKLVKALLIGANLDEIVLMGTDMTGANLVEARVRNSRLVGVRLNDSKLEGALFGSTQLSFSNFDSANMQRINLMLASLNRVNLNRANLTEAELAGTIFADTDLTDVVGLETTRHSFPSTIGTDTFHRTRGRIPEIFLRKCGLTKESIAFAQSIAGSPAEFNSCFISYSTSDEEFAQRLHNDLQANSVRCWFAGHDMQGGKKVSEQIDDAIRVHDRMLLILSPNSLNSHWVKREIAKALKRGVDEKRQVLFPIRLVDFGTLRTWEYFDADTGTDYAKEVREYFIPDFSNWKNHDSYQTAFKALLRDLRGERTKAETASK